MFECCGAGVNTISDDIFTDLASVFITDDIGDLCMPDNVKSCVVWAGVELRSRFECVLAD